MSKSAFGCGLSTMAMLWAAMTYHPWLTLINFAIAVVSAWHWHWCWYWRHGE